MREEREPEQGRETEGPSCKHEGKPGIKEGKTAKSAENPQAKGNS